MAADQKSQAQIRNGSEQPLAPLARAFRARRRIAASGTSRIAKAHWNNGDVCCVVESIRCHSHPVPQPVARRVGKGNAARVDLGARGLAGDEDSRGRSEEQTSELQSLMRISYAVFCLKKKKNTLLII